MPTKLSCRAATRLVALFGLIPALASAATLDASGLLASVQQALDADNIQPIIAIEAQSLPTERAVRVGEGLILKLGSGRQMVFRDLPQCTDETHESGCEQFKLVAYQNRTNTFLVAHVFYEDLRFIP